MTTDAALEQRPSKPTDAVFLILLRLIAQGRLARQSAQDGDASRVQVYLNQRDVVITKLRQLAQRGTVSVDEAEPLLSELAREDDKTLEHLEALRRRLGTELSSLRGSQQALSGYSRLAEPTASLLEKDF